MLGQHGTFPAGSAPWRASEPARGLGFVPALASPRERWLILLLPLVLLACNGAWLWDSPVYFDTNVYLGFFKHYLDFKLPFTANYKSSRLPFVLPGVLFYRVLPAALAHHLLVLGFLLAQALAMYRLVARRFGARAAYVTAAALVTSTFSHTLSSYHNQAAAMYFVLALLALEAPARAPWPLRFALGGALYAFGFTTDSLLGLLGPFFAMHAVGAVPRPWRVWRIAVAGGLAGAGAVGGLALLGVLNVALGGPFLFFMEQMRYSAALAAAPHGISGVPASLFARELFRFPALILPAIVGVASIGFLVVGFSRRRFGWATAEMAGYVVSVALAAWAQDRGLAVLEQHCLFQVFMAPMYLALGAILGRFGARGDTWVGWRFALCVAAFFVLPLALFGGLASRLLVWLTTAWPLAAHGGPFVVALAVVAAVLAWRWRARNPLPAIAIAAALGLANPLCTEPTQPAYLYQAGASCSFRSDTFEAVLEVDRVISGFDPQNEARWVSAGSPFEEPLYDGHDFCHRLSAETAARSTLLAHYFYTSDELVYGPRARGQKKYTVVATSEAQMVTLLGAVRAELPRGFDVRRRIAGEFPHKTFTLLVAGFDVVPAESPTGEARAAPPAAPGAGVASSRPSG